MADLPPRTPNRGEATAAVLGVLSDLAPDRRAPTFDVRGAGPTQLAWIGALPATSETGDATTALDPTQPRVAAATDRTPELEALARHDALTPDTDDLRLGWLWVTGEAEVDGARKTITLPLLSRPVRASRLLRRMALTPQGPWDLWPLVADEQIARELERSAAFGGGALDQDISQALVDRLPQLRTWVDEVVAASGLPPVSALLAPTDPRRVRTGGGLVAVVGYAAFAEEAVDLTHPRQTLAAWCRDRQVANTAFAALYLGATGLAQLPPPPADRVQLTPGLPLNDRQAEVVLRSRTSAVTVVSGPPGTGKSQTAAAVALDAVARGETVLIATRSTVAADVVAGLLEQLPGPDPVLFGGSVRARKLAARLADGLASPPGTGAQARLAQVQAEHEELAGAVRAELDGVLAADRWARRSLTLARHALTAPRLLDPDATATVAEVTALLDRSRRPGGLFGGRRRRRAAQELRELVGAPAEATLDDVSAALELARLRDLAHRATNRDPARSLLAWEALARVDHEHRVAAAEALAERVAGSTGSDGQRAVAALATALRAGRAARRSHLARVDVASLTRALPLWVGTLGEIETLLPPTAGGFDLVVLDEASQIDQFSASAALLRARRAVVIGDPRQLRFVSFVPDRDVAATIAAHGATPIGDRLDVRRVSAYDLAAGAAPVTFLDEHYRSVPHLIGFSAQRFYDGRLLVATRTLANQCRVAIEVRELGGRRSDGVNEVEVAAALALVHELLAADPATTIGVVSPYRAQVSAIEVALADQLELEVLQSGRVRVGTVHAFQGAECDVVIASFGIGGATDRGRAFLEDPNLFNVLVTRARRRLVVLSSGEAPTAGLLAEYLAWARLPPAPPLEGRPADEWTGRLATTLRDAGTAVHVGYPVGRWTIDLAVGTGDDAVAVATGVHPDGIDAHVARHLALARAGWRQAEAFPTDQDGDAVATALALAAR